MVHLLLFSAVTTALAFAPCRPPARPPTVAAFQRAVNAPAHGYPRNWEPAYRPEVSVSRRSEVADRGCRRSSSRRHRAGHYPPGEKEGPHGARPVGAVRRQYLIGSVFARRQTTWSPLACDREARKPPPTWHVVTAPPPCCSALAPAHWSAADAPPRCSVPIARTLWALHWWLVFSVNTPSLMRGFAPGRDCSSVQARSVPARHSVSPRGTGGTTLITTSADRHHARSVTGQCRRPTPPARRPTLLTSPMTRRGSGAVIRQGASAASGDETSRTASQWSDQRPISLRPALDGEASH